MDIYHEIPPRFQVRIDREACRLCERCTINCTYDVLSFNGERIVAKAENCVSCQRCATMCPQRAISITPGQIGFAPHGTYSERIRRILYEQASTGGVMLAGSGTDLPYRVIFDDILLDAAQVTNPSIDPLREPVETVTYLGRKPDHMVASQDDGRLTVDRGADYPNVRLSTPLAVGHMSLGSISYNACIAIFRAATEFGIMVGTGEGGLHPDFYEYARVINSEVASGRFGIEPRYLKDVAALEIKIGQGAKPGHGGHLPGEKVDSLISETRMIPVGTDALSPYPHHDIYSIEDLAQLIGALKEASRYRIPVGVKIAAVHNSAPIASGIARAGADFITLDGLRGGTGAAPRIIRDHAGIPIELAVASVDRRLREEGIRHRVSIVAGGSVRYGADLVKILALGADVAMIGQPALIAMGCRSCQMCHLGNCSWGIATQRNDLVRRLDVDIAAERLVNLFHAWTEELREILGALGIDAVESLVGNRDRLRYIGPNPRIAEVLGVKHAGEPWSD
ncbi:MAG: glutamate synthase-related protein [Candidatus Zixiibacteriota bacterium]|jgi:glutamate synthase domain-containing protein 2